MYLHLGDDVLTKLEDVIMIINSEDSAGVSTNADFLANVAAKGMVKNIDQENNKAIVITDHRIFMSPISVATLKKRANFINDLV
jgi:hypothetical protein